MSESINFTNIIESPEYATTVDNWLIQYQNENGVNISRPMVEKSNCVGMYALCESKLIGGITFNIHNDWIFLNCGYILPDFRGRGVYLKLIRDVEVFAKSAGLSGVFLSTYEFEAPKLYERMGYTKGSVLPNLPKGNTNIDYYKVF